MNYDWGLEESFKLDPSFKAQSVTGKWKLQQVLEDTTKMADYFLDHAEELSQLKRSIFGKQLKSTRKIVKELDDDQLYKWMEINYKQDKEEASTLM